MGNDRLGDFHLGQEAPERFLFPQAMRMLWHEALRVQSPTLEKRCDFWIAASEGAEHVHGFDAASPRQECFPEPIATGSF